MVEDEVDKVSWQSGAFHPIHQGQVERGRWKRLAAVLCQIHWTLTCLQEKRELRLTKERKLTVSTVRIKLFFCISQQVPRMRSSVCLHRTRIYGIIQKISDGSIKSGQPFHYAAIWEYFVGGCCKVTHHLQVGPKYLGHQAWKKCKFLQNANHPDFRVDFNQNYSILCNSIMRLAHLLWASHIYCILPRHFCGKQIPESIIFDCCWFEAHEMIT